MSIAYLLRKLFAPALYPLSISLELLLIGLVLLWFSRRQKAGKWFVTAGTLVLVCSSYTPTARWLLSPLEYRYPVADARAADGSGATPGPKWIVVLGGGYTANARLPVTSQLSPGSLARLVEGIRLHKRYPGTKMIISGGREFSMPAEAGPIARTAEILGVDRADIVLESESLDTEDQGRHVSALVGGEPFFLVTSAAHVPRAAALFRKRGLHPIPAPADFEIKGGGGFTPLRLYPYALNTVRTEKALYEYLGLAWARLKGAI